MKFNTKHTSILAASAAIALGLLVSNVANAGASVSRGGNARSAHANIRGAVQSHGGSNLANHPTNGSYTGSRGTANYSGNAFSTGGLTTQASVTGKAGNTFVHDGNISVNKQTKEFNHTRSTVKQDNTGYTISSHESNVHIDATNGIAEHAHKSVIVDKTQHKTVHRDVDRTVTTHSDGTKDLVHSVSAESNSVGTTINGHNATNQFSTETNAFTHEGWSVVNGPDGRTGGTHNGNVSISKDADDITQIDHTYYTAKFVEESIVKERADHKHYTNS